MKPKPKHLGPEYGEQFSDPSVVSAYRHRPPYPRAVGEILADLVHDRPSAILEIGSGTGDLTVLLAERFDQIDAVEPSTGMLAAARRRCWGRDDRIDWINAPFETAPLNPPYALAAAGQSLHWTDWSVSIPKIRKALLPGARIALVERRVGPCPWDAAVQDLLPIYSTNREYRPYDLVQELAERGLFREEGRAETAPIRFRETVDDFVEAHHSGNGFSRDRMDPAAAAAFDTLLRELVEPHAHRGELDVTVTGIVVFGK